MRPSILPLLGLATGAAAECGCGYTVNSTLEPEFALFTDLLETDFLHAKDVTFNESYSVGWQPQDYITNVGKSDGPYGMAKISSNLVPNDIPDRHTWGGPGRLGPDPGLQLWVRSKMLQENDQSYVPCAEMVSQRDDILYGSFRIAMKTTGVNGTCGAFFTYRNDSQEIDVEVLSAEQHGSGDWPVHLVSQDTSLQPEHNDTASSQLIYQLPHAAGGNDAVYHEYRFDWLPDRIDFWVDNWYMWTTTENIPSTPGRIHISHWSNGNPFWSHGPPVQDAVMTVSYVKAYFNSTNTTRISEYNGACGGKRTMVDEMCTIPNQVTAPDPNEPDGNSTGRTFFFTLGHNMTKNQTVYDNPLGSKASGLGDDRKVALTVLVVVGWLLLPVGIARYL